MKNITECARSAVMLDGEISKYVDILQGVAQGCTLSPNIFKVNTNDVIVAVETAKQGVTMGEETVSGLMFADDFVAISVTTTEGLQLLTIRVLEICLSNREGTINRVRKEMESDSEREKMRSSCM